MTAWTGKAQKLTKRVVDAAQTGAARVIFWDGELPGFGLRIEPSGRKTFIARYRAGGGRTGTLRQATLGRYGTITVDEARALARKTLCQAAAGLDPVGDKRHARRAGVTVAEVCDWYLAEAEKGRLLGRRGRPIKASTLAQDRSRIDVHVKPLIGRRPVRSLTTADLEGMQADIAARAPGTAPRVLGMTQAIFNHASRKGLIEVNPARGARMLAGNKRTARLALEDIRALGEAMRSKASAGESPVGLALVRLVLLTGFRRSEAQGLQRQWIIRAGAVDFPDTKSGPQIRIIGKAALALVGELPAVEGVPWVFPSEHGEGRYTSLWRVLDRLAARAGLSGVSPHVLRHTYASIAGDLGFSELTIAGLLGHKGGGVTRGYVHLDVALVAAADRVASVIAAALDGKPEAEIVPLRKQDAAS